MKHEWRKAEKPFYLPKNKPEIIEVPCFSFITLKGEGNPSTDHFSSCISALYSLAYAVKMTLKKVVSPPNGYTDYTVYPLDGDINEEAKKKFTGVVNKDDFVYTLMLRQPDFVEEAFFEEMRTFTQKKKPHPLLGEVKFEKIADGKCIQMLHVGSYDDEPASFEQMEDFAESQGLKRKSKVHREIYLSDFRKVPEEKLKTVLRFKV